MPIPITPRPVILDTSHSPFAHLQPVPIDHVSLGGGFWQSRLRLIQEVTIPSQYQMLESTGRLDNFRRVHGDVQKPFQGLVFNDSDVYKWLEAACWSRVSMPEGKLDERIDQVINLISNAQDKDGYLDTYFSFEKIRRRWMNLQENHELYCAGHLIQAAVAHHRVTGNYRLLNVALRLADNICRTFGPSQVEGTCGHPEIEMALIELYRTTGEKKYLDQAAVFIDRRGHGLLGGRKYLLDHLPFRQMDRLVGHAVRALYLCSGATDLWLEKGDGELKLAVEHLWDRLVTQQMYITGGVGSRYEGEAIGAPYELPNARAYAETCAAIGNLMWNERLLQMGGDAKYADLVEWALYNAVLPGISLNGIEYFYINPLQDDGSHRRSAWFDCACCPPNIARAIAAFPGIMYSISKQGIWLHMFAQSQASFDLANGQRIVLEQFTAYPWDGKIELDIKILQSDNLTDMGNPDAAQFSIFIRMPAWVGGLLIPVAINGKPFRHHAISGAYLEIHRKWESGDRVKLELPMEPRFILSHPMVAENHYRLAISRGPLIYCLEAIDNPGINLASAMIDQASPLESEFIADLLGGVARLYVSGFRGRSEPGWDHRLYREFHPEKKPYRGRPVVMTYIPYFAWANREKGAMSIWQQFQ